MGQKRRCILFPLSAMLTKSRSSPVIDIPAEGKHTLTAAFPVARNWQTRHQHSRLVMGSANVAYLTAPQRQPPEIVIQSSSTTPTMAASLMRLLRRTLVEQLVELRLIFVSQGFVVPDNQRVFGILERET